MVDSGTPPVNEKPSDDTTVMDGTVTDSQDKATESGRRDKLPTPRPLKMPGETPVGQEANTIHVEERKDKTPSSPAQIKMPKFIGDQWEVIELLGEGGMSTVYKARHKVLQRTAAIKVLLPGLVSRKQSINRFEREARALSTLEHPNIVSVHDYGMTDDGQAYLVVELLEGVCLQDLIDESGPMEPERALPLFQQICAAVGHAHGKGILHRDLKPGNVMLVKQDGKEVVRLVDFGLAKLYAEEEGAPAKLTATGDVVGTPYYMSPEQCSGKPMDARSDIYSLGCLMYEVLGGQPPFSGEFVIEVVQKQLTAKPEPLVPVNAPDSLMKRLNTIVLKCLAKNPNNRYQSIAEVEEALSQCVSRSSSYWEQKAKTARSLHEQKKPSSRVLAAIIGGWLLALCGIAAGIFLFVRTDSAPVINVDRSLWITSDSYRVSEEPQFELKKAQAVKALDLAAQQPDFTPRRKAESWMKLADFYRANGHWSEARLWYAKAGSLFERMQGRRSWEVAYAEKNLAICAFFQGDVPVAEKAFQTSLSIIESLLRDPSQPQEMVFRTTRSEELLEPLQFLEIIYSQRDELEKARAVCRDIITIYGNMRGYRREKILWRSEQADIERRAKDYPAAEALYRHAIAEWKQFVGSDDIDAIRCAFGLGMALKNQKRFTEAEEVLAEVLNSAKRRLNNQDPLLVSIQREYADALWRDGKWIDSLLSRKMQ